MNQSSSPNRPTRGLARFAILAALVASAPPALADINIGVIVSTDRPGGVARHPRKAAIKLWPTELGARRSASRLNDASDTTTADEERPAADHEDKVDVIIGASVTPTSLAVVETPARAACR